MKELDSKTFLYKGAPKWKKIIYQQPDGLNDTWRRTVDLRDDGYLYVELRHGNFYSSTVVETIRFRPSKNSSYCISCKNGRQTVNAEFQVVP